MFSDQDQDNQRTSNGELTRYLNSVPVHGLMERLSGYQEVVSRIDVNIVFVIGYCTVINDIDEEVENGILPRYLLYGVRKTYEDWNM